MRGAGSSVGGEQCRNLSVDLGREIKKRLVARECERPFYGAFGHWKAAFGVEVEQGRELAGEECGGIGEEGIELLPELRLLASEGFGGGFEGFVEGGDRAQLMLVGGSFLWGEVREV